MKVTLERADPGSYLLVAEDGADLLFQVDWDFAGLATAFGWQACDCSCTDGTVDCDHRKASEMLTEAGSYLDDQLGTSVDDPGYFA